MGSAKTRRQWCGIGMLLVWGVAVGSAYAQESVVNAPRQSMLSLADLTSRTQKVQAELVEWAAVIDAAIACNEAGKLYVPQEAGSGSCKDMPLPTIMCSCGGGGITGGGGGGDAGYDGFGNVGGDFSDSRGGADGDRSTPD